MKKSIYFMLIAICCSLAACKKGDAGPAGADGKNGINGTNGKDGNAGPAGPAGPTGPQGPAGATGPAGPANPPNVKIQTLTIQPGQWQISGTNGYGFSINPAVPFGGAIAYFNTTGTVNDYEALPYSDGNFSLNVVTNFNTATANNVAIIYKDISDRTRRPATNIYIKLVTFSGINVGAVKERAGSLGLNDVARYAEGSSKQ